MEDPPRVFAADAEAVKVTAAILRALPAPPATDDEAALAAPPPSPLAPRTMVRPAPWGRGPRRRTAVPRPPVRSRHR